MTDIPLPKSDCSIVSKITNDVHIPDARDNQGISRFDYF